MLVARRNARVKLACEEKPERNAISLKGNSAGADHPLCGLETSLADIALWRDAHRVGERPREMKYTEVGHPREVADGEFFLEILVDVVQDTSHPRVTERTSRTRDTIDQVSIDVILDQARREHQRRHLREHSTCRRRLRYFIEN